MKKISNHFYDVELVGPEIIKSGLPATWFIDKNWVLNVLDPLVDRYGPMIVNNWNAGGQYKESGFRSPGTSTGAGLSQHKFKAASDLKPKKMTCKELYEAILKDEKYWLEKGLTAIENINATPSWVHVDGRWTMMDKILIVNP